MRRFARTPVFIAFIAAASCVIAACANDDPRATTSALETIPINANATGRSLPAVILQTTDGESLSTATFYGRPLLVNFWYSTCEPCRREMPALAEAHDIFGDRVNFIGVNMSDPAVVAQNFADRYGVTFPILLDNGSALTLELGISIAPTTLFVDASGTIIEQVSGELTSQTLSSYLTELVKS